MGKGDRKTAKGKRTIGTYGNSRRKKKSVAVIVKTNITANPRPIDASTFLETAKNEHIPRK